MMSDVITEARGLTEWLTEGGNGDVAKILTGLCDEVEGLRAALQQAQARIDVLEPPAQNYNRTLARAEKAEATLQQAREALEEGFPLNRIAKIRARAEMQRTAALPSIWIGTVDQGDLSEACDAIEQALATLAALGLKEKAKGAP